MGKLEIQKLLVNLSKSPAREFSTEQSSTYTFTAPTVHKQCINPYLMNCTTGANEMWIVGKGGANCLSNPAHSNRIYIISLSEILWITLQ